MDSSHWEFPFPHNWNTWGIISADLFSNHKGLASKCAICKALLGKTLRKKRTSPWEQERGREKVERGGEVLYENWGELYDVKHLWAESGLSPLPRGSRRWDAKEKLNLNKKCYAQSCAVRRKETEVREYNSSFLSPSFVFVFFFSIPNVTSMTCILNSKCNRGLP